MIPWINMNIINLVALILLPVFSLIGLYYFGQKSEVLWRKTLVWLFGYGLIALTVITKLINVNFLTRIVFRVGYLPVSIGLMCNWITYDVLPFLSVFYFLSITKTKRSKFLVASVIFTILFFLLTVLHGWANRPMR